MSKQRYRSEMGTISDILRVIIDCDRQGTGISSIARKANLSHYTAIEKCQKLIDCGIMKSVMDKRNHYYTITEKGIQFFQEMQIFLASVQAVKIRY